MRDLIDFLLNQPLVLFVLLAWIAGMIGNVIKAAARSRERAEQQRRMPPAGPPPARPGDPHRPTADEVAAEMRRILGMEPEPPRQGPPPVSARDRAPARRRVVQQTQPRLAPPSAPARRRDVVLPERPPTPLEPSVQQRRIALQRDPRVGESIAQREHRPRAGADSRQLGSLGGRVRVRQQSREALHRFPLDDLKTAFVLSEILGPPLALRPPGAVHQL